MFKIFSSADSPFRLSYRHMGLPQTRAGHFVCPESLQLLDVSCALPLRGANPTYTKSELVYQLQTVKAQLLFTHPLSLEVALKAAKEANVPLDRIILFDKDPSGRLKNLEQLVQEGRYVERVYNERRLRKGEAKTKIAFYSFSSGTTGRPKVSQLR